MQDVEAQENKIVLANSDGKIYALLRSMHSHERSTINRHLERKGRNMHGARFDVITAKKVGEPMAPDP